MFLSPSSSLSGGGACGNLWVGGYIDRGVAACAAATVTRRRQLKQRHTQAMTSLFMLFILCPSGGCS